jgi:hypothetical protein
VRTIEEIKADIQKEDEASGGTSPLLAGMWLEYYHTVTASIPIDELETMCAAWKDKRCVVLLPIDTIAYIVQDGEILEFRVYRYSLLSVNGSNVWYWAECVTNDYEDDMDFWSDDIGECVFLTRPEAEAALKGASND